MEYEIKFDENNLNQINIFKDGKLQTIIACPFTEKGCDIINFSDKINEGYTFNFDGLIIISSSNSRKIYYRGELLDEVEYELI